MNFSCAFKRISSAVSQEIADVSARFLELKQLGQLYSLTNIEPNQPLKAMFSAYGLANALRGYSMGDYITNPYVSAGELRELLHRADNDRRAHLWCKALLEVAIKSHNTYKNNSGSPVVFLRGGFLKSLRNSPLLHVFQKYFIL